MSLASYGYIDCAFIRPSAQGTGVFRRLYESIEVLARRNNETRLWVHASLMAQPAFGAMGFVITKRETVQVGDRSYIPARSMPVPNPSIPHAQNRKIIGRRHTTKKVNVRATKPGRALLANGAVRNAAPTAVATNRSESRVIPPRGCAALPIELPRIW